MHTKVLASICLLAACHVSSGFSHVKNSRDLFNDFKKTYNKVYESEEENERRFVHFLENMERAEAAQRRERGTARYGVTQFSDLTVEEFKQFGLSQNPELQANKRLTEAVIPEVEIPQEFDWRKKGVVTEVKSQEACWSCWAFSAVGNIEGQWAIHKHKLISLSEQELVDCDKEDKGCKGGLMTSAYEAVISLGGLMTEKDYPYKGNNQSCSFNKKKVAVTINGSVSIPTDEQKMAKWLFKNGPIAIGLNSNNMQFYHNGVAHPQPQDCDPEKINHGTLIVGYGVEEDKTPFWIIKNSWGKSWGEEGYYRVYRGGGICGLNSKASSAVI